MRASNKVSNRMAGIMDTIRSWIDTGSEYVDVSVTEKATTAAQDSVIQFAEKFGLDKLLPTRKTSIKPTSTNTGIQGIDPKILWLIAGIGGGLVLLIFLKKKKKI